MVQDSASPANKIDVQRLKDSLTRMGYSFVEDEESASVLRARFDSYPFTFAITGENEDLLVVRGRWDQLLPVQQKLEAAKVCNHWNMERMWPKVYVRRENDEALGVYGENVVDFTYGASDAAIDRAINCSLTTSISFFKSLEDEIEAPTEEAVQPTSA